MKWNVHFCFYTLKLVNKQRLELNTFNKGSPLSAKSNHFILEQVYYKKYIFCLIQNMPLWNFYFFVLFMLIGYLEIQSKGLFSTWSFLT